MKTADQYDNAAKQLKGAANVLYGASFTEAVQTNQPSDTDPNPTPYRYGQLVIDCPTSDVDIALVEAGRQAVLVDGYLIMNLHEGFARICVSVYGPVGPTMADACAPNPARFDI